MDAYGLWKTAHVVSAAILFGTGLGIAFFAWFGYRRALLDRRIEGLRLVLRLTVIADTCFTAPAVIFQLLSGLVLIRINGWPTFRPWSLWVFSLFALTGACWLPVVVIQLLLSREGNGTNSVDALSQRFHRRYRWWVSLGVPAFLAVVGIFWLMVAKPLPAEL